MRTVRLRVSVRGDQDDPGDSLNRATTAKEHGGNEHAATTCKAGGSLPAMSPVAMSPYVIFLIYMFAILSVVALMLLLNRVLGPKPVDTAVKLEPFECGATPVDPRNVKAVPIKYYAVAIVFILFDLETVFLFIWALGAQPVTGTMLVTFIIFMALLVLILLYVYRARLLEGVTE